jgi:MoaA/NifB/PqqE/SkfB family radical SAM enzyme
MAPPVDTVVTGAAPVVAAPALPARWKTSALVSLGALTNRTLALPVLVFYATSRCNSRCLSCEWWRSDGATDLRAPEVEDIAASLPALGTRVVAFSGGEPLVRPDVFRLAAAFRRSGAELHLVTSGILLDRHADAVGEHFARVTVSLDGADAAGYRAVRGIDGLARIEAGIARLRARAPAVPITARATMHRVNYAQMPAIVARARAIGVDRLSFLAADLSSPAFGGAPGAVRQGLALNRDEVVRFRAVVERTLVQCRAEIESGFVAESPARLRALATYYSALLGDEPFPPVTCNAPSISVVLEADGTVRPCFFHPPLGNVRHTSLVDLVTRALPAFRRELDMSCDPTCTRCVCSIRTGWRRVPW